MRRERSDLLDPLGPLRRGLPRIVALAAILAGCAQLSAGLPFASGQATAPIPTEASISGLSAVTRAPVAEVVDGDTVRVRIDGRNESIRVIGIEAPESVDPRRPVECFGREAAARAHELLDRQEVRLIPDPSQGARDQYRRILAYVELPDGRDYGLTMIAEGYAHEFAYGQPYERLDRYRAAETQARDGRRGFWSPTTCGGDTQQPASESDARRTAVAGEPPFVPPTPEGTAAATRAPAPPAPTGSPSTTPSTRPPAGTATPAGSTTSRTPTAPASRSATPAPTNAPTTAGPTASPHASGTATPATGTPARSATASATARTTPTPR